MTSKVVLITGASSGIGLATAELLHEAGFIVYGTSRRTNNASKYKFHLIELDVNHDDSVNHAIEKVLENEGRIDVLINNAGFAIAPAGAEEPRAVHRLHRRACRSGPDAGPHGYRDRRPARAAKPPTCGEPRRPGGGDPLDLRHPHHLRRDLSQSRPRGARQGEGGRLGGLSLACDIEPAPCCRPEYQVNAALSPRVGGHR